MKKTLPIWQISLALVVVALVIFFVGRSRLAATPDVPTASRAPAGLTLILDAGVPNSGAEIYTADGKVFGTVLAYEANHSFPNGVPAGPALSIKNKAAAEPVWMPMSIVGTTYYVKK